MSISALVVQLVNGLAGAASLFLVAAGLTLIFGVTRIVNFAHGSLYMIGAYVAFSIGETLRAVLGDHASTFFLAVVAAALAVGLLGAAIERLVLQRLYDAPELLQLTATFALVLVARDSVLAAFGAEDRLGPRVPGWSGSVQFLGRAIPQYDLLLVVVAALVFAILAWMVARTRFGTIVRAASENRVLTQALGIDQRVLFTAVFVLGSILAGLAGALALPREPANLGMDLPVIADAFVVTVVGGLGSITGAFVAAILIGVARALCIAAGTVDLGGWSIAFPKLSLVVEFIVMAVVLLIRPWGLLGRAPAYAIATTLPEQRALVIAPGRRSLIAAAIVACAAAVMPLLHHPYALVLGTDILVAALFAASLQIITGTAGMTSFGHAAFFGLGAYGAALALRGGWPFAVALASGVALAAIAACVLALLVVRLSGVYLAMLTLAFAQILWSIALQWDDVTGGSNGIVGVWPPAMLASRHAYYVFVLALAGVGLVALVRIAFAPFGRSLRAARDAPVRAAALGIPVARRRAQALAISGAFAGLAGALYVFAKGSVSPDALSIPRSVDVLVMMLLGGLNAVFGPLLGAATFVWLQDSLARWTEYWRACVGAGILILVLAFPGGLGGAIERARVARAVERP